MIENREFTMDDYLAMLRRRAKVILFPVLGATLLGFVAYLVVERKFARYTSTSLVLIESQKVPEKMVDPVVSDDLQTRIGMLKAQATSDSEMHPVLVGLFPRKSSSEIDAMLEDMRTQPQLVGAPFSDLSQITGSTVKRKPGQSQSPGFQVQYIASNPVEAQKVCEALTSKIIDKNLQFIQANAKGTVDVLSRGLEDARNKLNEAGSKLAAFKNEHTGQLPSDQDNNLKILQGLNAQDDRNTQNLNLAQQDKSFNQAALTQQLAAWKSTQSSTNPQTLQKQLSDLQAQLIDLQARYTDDHPDVIKTRADIAEVKKKLAEINKASEDAPDASGVKASGMEPVDVRNLRVQIHHDDDAIAEATRERKRLQALMGQYQQHLTLSPGVEETYSQLKSDYESADKNYNDILGKKSNADLTANMTNQAQGERMSEVQPANLPESPSFPNPWLFVGGGLAAGLVLGIVIALWLELRDTSIRTEADAEAILQLPMLVSVPWVGAAAVPDNKGKFKLWNRKSLDGPKEDRRETVGV
jgi:uncharacterized protein involved in exopolysaccharide biosynthesis